MRWQAPPAPEPETPALLPRLDRTQPWDEDDGLPPWRPKPPRGGWTPASARAAADAYARDATATHGGDVDRIARAAHHTLLTSDTRLHGADLVDRLQRARAAQAAEDAELDEATDDEPALPPF